VPEDFARPEANRTSCQAFLLLKWIEMQIDINSITSFLACPRCKQPLLKGVECCTCTNTSCSSTYPVRNHIPILINGENSVFHIDDYLQEQTSAAAPGGSKMGKIFDRLVPSITQNCVGERNFEFLASQLRERVNPKVLVVGAGELGVGFNFLLSDKSIALVETDVYFAPRVSIIADCHDLPFLDESFDAVIVQAVLEHVADPARCVDEIHRVLKQDGSVYAETPFMFPVHLGPYDFTRFTRSGHRRLFRKFSELSSGIASGPATALNLAIRSFLLSFSTSRLSSLMVSNLLPFFIFWIKYFDYWMVRKKHAADYSASFYFIGRKENTAISDRELIDMHWSRTRAST